MMTALLDNLTQNWMLYIAAIVVGIMTGIAVYKFHNLPKSKKAKKVKEWLIYAVAAAEKSLGAGTGRLKLRYVYDLAMEKFPIFIKFISFDDFSKMVDEALEEFQDMLKSEAIQNYLDKED